jgi:hypothetical protein
MPFDPLNDVPITREMIRLVKCPKCGALPGRACAGRTVRNHAERLERAQRIGGSSLLLMQQEREEMDRDRREAAQLDMGHLG